MLKSGILLTAIALFVIVMPSALHGQSRQGTVADSWKTASSQASAPAAKEGDSGAWGARRSPESHPWPALPDKPMRSDYHRANTMIIDSLSRLYCVSTSYLGTLRQRNESASAKPSSASGDSQFQYRAMAPPPQGRESLQSLYKELTGLLDRCLHGR